MAFSVSLKSYNASTGALVLQTADAPSGATVEYQIPGLRDWGTSPNFTVESFRLTGVTFTPKARANGSEITGTAFTTTASGFPAGLPTPVPVPTTQPTPVPVPTAATGTGKNRIYGIEDRQHIGYHGANFDLFARVTNDGKLFLVGIARNATENYCIGSDCSYVRNNAVYNVPTLMSSNQPGNDWLLISEYGGLLTTAERGAFAVQAVNTVPLSGFSNGDFIKSLAAYPTIADETQRRAALGLIIKRPDLSQPFVLGGSTAPTPVPTVAPTPTTQPTPVPLTITLPTATGTDQGIGGGDTSTATGTATDAQKKTNWITVAIVLLGVGLVAAVVWAFFIKK